MSSYWFEVSSIFKSNGDFTAQQEFVMRNCASEMAVKQTQICLSKVNPEIWLTTAFRKRKNVQPIFDTNPIMKLDPFFLLFTALVQTIVIKFDIMRILTWKC